MSERPRGRRPLPAYACFSFTPAITLAAALLLFALAAGCRREQPEAIVPETAPPPEAPRLVLFIVVDQVRADYLERFSPLFQGGLRRLLDEGTRFSEAHHHHALTVTGAGHATLSTGLHPSHHGIIGNGWYDRAAGEEVGCVEDEEHGRSPRRLLAGTLGDYLKTRYPAAKVYGIGGKDRSAILTAGLKADGAFFYDPWKGTFRTSSYYMPKLPDWLERFHEKRYLDQFFAKPWTPLVPPEELAPYDIVPVDWGWFERRFPYAIGGPSPVPDENFYDGISDTPFLDEYVVELAKALIEGEGLGQDEIPDFLGVTLSALDATGHTYGPNSAEMADTLLRVDRVLGGLLAYVDRVIGLDRVIVSLSSDHGVDPVPELLRERGVDAHRVDTEDLLCFQRIGARMAEKFGDARWFSWGLYLDRQLVGEKGIDLEEMRRFAADRLAECPRVERVFLASELESGVGLDELGRQYANSHHAERGPDLEVHLREHTLYSLSMATSHGSPYPYDTHVPWLVRLPGGLPRTVAERVYTIDVAPTLASYLGVRMEGRVDGQNRRELLEATTPEQVPATAPDSGSSRAR